MFISHTLEHNTDPVSADSAALNLPAQLQPACGSRLTPASAECHCASRRPSVRRSVPPPAGRCEGSLPDMEGADCQNPRGGNNKQEDRPSCSVRKNPAAKHFDMNDEMMTQHVTEKRQPPLHILQMLGNTLFALSWPPPNNVWTSRDVKST